MNYRRFVNWLMESRSPSLMHARRIFGPVQLCATVFRLVLPFISILSRIQRRKGLPHLWSRNLLISLRQKGSFMVMSRIAIIPRLITMLLSLNKRNILRFNIWNAAISPFLKLLPRPVESLTPPSWLRLSLPSQRRYMTFLKRKMLQSRRRARLCPSTTVQTRISLFRKKGIDTY